MGPETTKAVVVSDAAAQRVRELISRYPEQRSALIPILHEVQAELGHLSPEAVRWVADILGLSPADVMSVASFYDMFWLAPAGRHVICVCHNLTCSLLGAERLLAHLESRLGIRAGETTPDGQITLRRFECLASCGTGPAIQVDGTYHERMTPEKVDAVLASLREAK